MASVSPLQPQQRQPRIVVAGSINMDLVVRSARLPRPGETVIGRETEELPGGKGANQAVAAARLGAQVSLIARVGDDAFGAQLKAGLKSEGIDVGFVVVTPRCASGLAVVAVEDSGENAITVIPGANGRLTAQDVEGACELIRDADVLLVQLEVPLETVRAAIRVARQHETLVILDPAPAPSPAAIPPDLLSVDVACPNESEATALTGLPVDNLKDAERAALRLRALGTRFAVITLGDEGAVVCGPDGQCQHIPPFDIQAVDTTAAGDAFAAALGVGLARGETMTRAVQHACAAGAMAATRHGAQCAMPRAADVARLISRLGQ